MKRARFAILLAALSLPVAACAVVPQSSEAAAETTAAPEDIAAPTTPMATAEVAPAPTPSPTPTLPATFTFDGELTQGGFIRGQAPAGTVSAQLDEQALVLDDEGRFFAAFDRDAATQAQLVATLDDGREVRETVSVSARSWNIERVNVARRPGGSSESFRRRRAPELDAIWDARTAGSEVNGWSEQFIWPVTGRISGMFGRQRIYRGEPGGYHSGIDIAQPTGTRFVAPAGGVVTLATQTPFSLEGYLLIIDHGAGLNSAFLHLSDIAVNEGDVVEQGQLLGAIGASGRATGPHLHWSIKWHNARLDPILFTGPMP